MHRERIVLVGMMGVGKTTVGRGVAAQLEWPFYDNDELVAEMTGRPAAEIFQAEGEVALHSAERAAFKLALRKPAPTVITTAGSVVDDPHATRLLASAGWVVWLDAEANLLVDRIAGGAGRRSDASNAAFLRELRDRRGEVWARLAHQYIAIDNLDPAEVIAMVATGHALGSRVIT